MNADTADSAGPEQSLPIVGWREWLALPELGIESIKAKIDTGARTSSLHAQNLRSFRRDDQQWVSFDVPTAQGKKSPMVRCEAPVVDHREVKNSGGGTELRIVVGTTVRINGENWPIELTLTDRKRMKFRMLLGRTALRGRVLVNPARSFLLGRKKTES